jgi:NAD-dependent DNA ligase
LSLLILIVLVLAAAVYVWVSNSQRSAVRARLEVEAHRQALADAEREAADLAAATRVARDEMVESFGDVRLAMSKLVADAEQLDAAAVGAPARRRTRGRAAAAASDEPIAARRERYWRSPREDLATDAVVEAHINAATQLGDPIEICFTGWTDVEKAYLQGAAVDAACTVRTGVAKHLTFLCVGETPGAVKLAEAAAHGVPLISADQFERIICRQEGLSMPF